MSWIEKLLPAKIQPSDPTERRSVPEGLWIKCPSCETVLYKSDLEQNQNVCPTCSHHHRIGARARLNVFLDGEGRYEIGQEVLPVDALKFKDSRKYTERLKEALDAIHRSRGRRASERESGFGDVSLRGCLRAKTVLEAALALYRRGFSILRRGSGTVTVRI
jgi:hypothetical protein